MDNGQRVFEGLAVSKVFRDFKVAFQAATGISISIEPAESVISLNLKQVRDSKLFPSVRQLDLHRQTPSQLVCLEWAPEVCEIIFPVQVGQRVLALIRTGCVLQKKLSATEVKRVFGKLLTRVDDGEPVSVTADALPIISRSRLLSVCGLLFILGEYLAEVSNRLMLQHAPCEPAAIIKAKQYIHQNHREPLALIDVAANSHVSPYYLCKLFKRISGINFSDYLTRTRLETAKQLLLKDNRRINDVALDAGFRSLTHFNRVFRSLVGKSPRDFRKGNAPNGQIRKMIDATPTTSPNR